MFKNNRQEKSFPILRILGTDFIVDFELSEFRQVDNPSNKFSLEKLEYDSMYNGYPMLFDKHTRNIYHGSIPSEKMYPDVERVLIPELTLLGTQTLSYADPINEFVQFKKVDAENLRTLPTVMIDNTDFIVDLRRNEFRQTDKSENRISLHELFPIGPAHIGFFFDPQTKNVFKGTEDEKSRRTDVKLIELPSLAILDPEGMKERIREATAQVRANRNKPIVIPKETKSTSQEFFLSRSKKKDAGYKYQSL